MIHAGGPVENGAEYGKNNARSTWSEGENLKQLEVDELVVTSIFLRKLIIFRYHFLQDIWHLISILWNLFDCVCFMVHEICTFALVLLISKFLAFESLRPNGISPFWFAISRIVVSVLRPRQDIHHPTPPSDCWLHSSLFCRLGALVKCVIGVG